MAQETNYIKMLRSYPLEGSFLFCTKSAKGRGKGVEDEKLESMDKGCTC